MYMTEADKKIKCSLPEYAFKPDMMENSLHKSTISMDLDFSCHGSCSLRDGIAGPTWMMYSKANSRCTLALRFRVLDTVYCKKAESIACGCCLTMVNQQNLHFARRVLKFNQIGVQDGNAWQAGRIQCRLYH